MRQKMLKSMSLKQFLTTIETYAFAAGVQESEFVAKFLEVVEEEKLIVSATKTLIMLLVLG